MNILPDEHSATIRALSSVPYHNRKGHVSPRHSKVFVAFSVIHCMRTPPTPGPNKIRNHQPQQHYHPPPLHSGTIDNPGVSTWPKRLDAASVEVPLSEHSPSKCLPSRILLQNVLRRDILFPAGDENVVQLLISLEPSTLCFHENNTNVQYASGFHSLPPPLPALRPGLRF